MSEDFDPFSLPMLLNSYDFRRGFYAAGDCMMDFINALDTSNMDAKAVRSAVYGFCLSLIPTHERLASATEARRAETAKTGSIHDGAVPQADAPESPPSPDKEGV